LRVEVSDRRDGRLREIAEGHYEALGSPADGPGNVKMRGDHRAAWKDEVLERGQSRLHRVDALLQAFDSGRRDAGEAVRSRRRGEMGADLEQVVLDLFEIAVDRSGRPGCPDKPDPRVELVDRSV